MSGFDQSSIAVSMPTVIGADAALGGPYKIKPSEAFSGALMTVSGLTGETISVETSPDGYWGAPVSPTFYRTDWQGTQQLYPTSRTNLLIKSAWIGGPPATGWTQVPVGTGAATQVASTIFSGDGASAITFNCPSAADRIIYQATSITTIGAQPYAVSVFVEELVGDVSASECIIHNTAGSTVSWPVCQANPSGGASGRILTGRLTAIITPPSTSLAVRYGLGVSAGVVSAKSVTLSRPQVEIGSSETGFILTDATAVTITDYTLSGGVITLAQTPVSGALLSYDDSVTPSPYFVFATGDGVRTQFAYDGVWGTLSTNSGKGNGIWQVDLRGAQAYRLVKSAGSETATVNMTLKRDALQYTNSAGTWSVT